MLRERHKSDKHRQGRKSKSSRGGGLDRSSEEDAVMVLERRVKHVESTPSSTTFPDGPAERKTDWEKTRGIPLTKRHFYEAFRVVERNRGGCGVDGQSLKDFRRQLNRNLYRLWNRVSSGSYFPSAVLEVGIPKDNGQVRYLGIPTVEDRIVQQVIKAFIEPRLEAIFRPESYGYRPGKGAHDALQAVRQNCKEYWWVLDMDISAFFDNVSHKLLNLALDRHVSEPWVRLLIQRWLEAPIYQEDKTLRYRQGSGTPQGGVISPLLSNLYLHYALDEWLANEFPQAKFTRYADDIIIQCDYEPRIRLIHRRVAQRLKACNLSLNEEKTKVVFCKSSGRSNKEKQITFDFLGYRFQPRVAKSKKRKGLIIIYDCAISPKSEKKISDYLNSKKLHLWSTVEIEDIAEELNSRLMGWINYYGKFNRYRLKRIMSLINKRLAKWFCKKYKRFKRSLGKAQVFLRSLADKQPQLFYHWGAGFKYA